MNRRLASGFLAVALLAPCLAACGASPGRSTSTASKTPAPDVQHPTPGNPAEREAPADTAMSTPPTHLVRATKRITRLTDRLGRHGFSISAVDLRTGRAIRLGASTGMAEGSIAKLDIAEALCLRHQRSGKPVSSETREQLAAMIEHSDNDAANELWVDLGERRGVAAANRTLGLHSTSLARGIYWGLSTTNAADQLVLLRNLVAAHGPLTRASQHAVLELMRHVESGQRWGVGAAADPHTRFANKNGWLANAADDDRWLVNSLGVITVHGHRVLMAVLTQHNASYDAGVDLTGKLARAVAAALD